MKKLASDDSTLSLYKTFWRWLAVSAVALILAAALPARSADVFIDEGDGDFAPTPVSSPGANQTTAGGKKPASEDVPPASPGSDLDSTIGQLEPSSAESSAPPAGDDLALPSEPATADMGVAQPEAPVEKPKKAASKKASKKKETKSAKKSSKSSKKSAATKASKKKKDKKAAAKKGSKKKSAQASKSSKGSKRKVASIGKFAGGQYATTSRSCAMESSPGAGDSVGTTKSAHKLWVEDSGNTSYWKVYGKSGNAAFVAKDCF